MNLSQELYFSSGLVLDSARIVVQLLTQWCFMCKHSTCEEMLRI